MIRSSILFVLTLVTGVSLAQQKIGELDLGITNKKKFLPEHSFLESLDTKQYLLAVACKDNMHFYLFDSSWKTNRQFDIQREASDSSKDSSGLDHSILFGNYVDSVKLKTNVFYNKSL